MENRYNVLNNYAVKISYHDNVGSGVIFKVGEKIFLLTACHVLEGDFNALDLYVERTNNGVEKKLDIKVINSIFDECNDVAVLLIESDELICNLKLYKPNIGQNIKMCGYPCILQNAKDIHTYTLTGRVSDTNCGKLCITINEKLGSFASEEKEMLDGFSGSGFFLQSGKTVQLCGVETNVLTRDVAYNAVCGSNVEVIISALEKLGVDEDLVVNESASFVVKQSELYMRYIVPFDEFGENTTSLEKLQQEYREGIAAQPVHIRNGLDVRRIEWINLIEEKFEESSIVVIRGASGQGKSSLAYRYLLEHFDKGQILCVPKITSESSIWEIVRFLKKELEDFEYIIYYDVQPGDEYWGTFLSTFSTYLSNVSLLVTVREDDYNLNKASHGSVRYQEVSLELNEDEARDIYSRYNQHKFRSFDDLWNNFGNGGPLLEFIYLLNHSVTLEEKINDQITHISTDIEEREWFNVLAIIAIAGQYDLAIRLDKLYANIELKNASKLLQQFEKEFFIKISDNRERVKCLHSVRARLILKSLEGKFGFDYLNSLLSTLSVIDVSTIYLLLEYFDKSGASAEIIDRLSAVSFNCLDTVADVLRGILWLSVKDYIAENKEIIDEGNRLFADNYVMFALGDITGFIDTNNARHDFLEILDKQTPGIADSVQGLVERQPQRYLVYEYAKLFLENISNFIVDYVRGYPVNGSCLGYLLFWSSKLNVALHIDSNIIFDNSKDYAGIALAIKGLMNIGNVLKANELKSIYEKDILCDANVVSLYEKNNEIHAEAVPNYYPASKENSELKNAAYNEKCMHVVNTLSFLYPNKERYNVSLLGTRIAGINLPDREKHIPRENLHDKWITEINGFCLRLCAYKNAPEDWKEVFNNINAHRNTITEFFEELLKQLGRIYKGKSFESSKLDRLILILQKEKEFSIPKSALDKFGIGKALNESEKKDNSNKKDLKQADKQSSDLPIEKECQKFFSGISNYINGLHNMLLGIIQNKQPEEYCRLQLYNIVSSYEVYHNFCNVNNHFFKEYKCEVDIGKERITLEKMVAVTHWIYLNGSHQENNIIYNAYEVLKKKKRAIDSFFEKGIGDYPEVREHALFDDDVIVFTDWENYDLLVEKIYHKVQELAGPSELISPARAYLFNRINCVRIVLSKNSYKDYLTIRIPINSFTLAKNIEQLQKYIFGAEKNYSFIPLEDLRDGAIASAILICDQAVQIEEALIVSSQYTVKESIASINKMLSAELEDVAKKIQELDECKDLYLDIKKIASLNIFTLDKVECRSNYNILEAFVSKYSS